MINDYQVNHILWLQWFSLLRLFVNHFIWFQIRNSLTIHVNYNRQSLVRLTQFCPSPQCILLGRILRDGFFFFFFLFLKSDLTLKKAAVLPPLRAPYLIFVCFARSSALSIGESILSTVRNAAKLAVYEEIMIKVKNHHMPATMRVDTALGKKNSGGAVGTSTGFQDSRLYETTRVAP